MWFLPGNIGHHSDTLLTSSDTFLTLSYTTLHLPDTIWILPIIMHLCDSIWHRLNPSDTFLIPTTPFQPQSDTFLSSSDTFLTPSDTFLTPSWYHTTPSWHFPDTIWHLPDTICHLLTLSYNHMTPCQHQHPPLSLSLFCPSIRQAMLTISVTQNHIILDGNAKLQICQFPPVQPLIKKNLEGSIYWVLLSVICMPLLGIFSEQILLLERMQCIHN